MDRRARMHVCLVLASVPGAVACFTPRPSRHDARIAPEQVDEPEPDAGLAAPAAPPAPLRREDAATAETSATLTATVDAGGGNPPDARASADVTPNATGIGCAAAKLCDDFEAYKPGMGLGAWKTAVGGGALALDGAHAYSGKQSLHVHSDPGSGRRAQINRGGPPLLPLTPNVMWGRMMVWITDLPGGSVHADLIQADDGSGGKQYRISYMGGTLLNYAPHDCYFNNGKKVPLQRWSCWEWQFDGTRNAIEYYVDGTLQAKVVDMGQGCVDGTRSEWVAPTWGAIRLGWTNYQSMSNTIDLWIDDVAVDGKRIGCAPAKAGEAH